MQSVTVRKVVKLQLTIAMPLVIKEFKVIVLFEEERGMFILHHF